MEGKKRIYRERRRDWTKEDSGFDLTAESAWDPHAGDCPNILVFDKPRHVYEKTTRTDRFLCRSVVREESEATRALSFARSPMNASIVIVRIPISPDD